MAEESIKTIGDTLDVLEYLAQQTYDEIAAARCYFEKLQEQTKALGDIAAVQAAERLQ